MQIKKTGIWWLFMIVLLAGCRPAAAPSPTPPPTLQASDRQTLPADDAAVPRITPAELAGLLSSPRKVVVIDVRGHEAYADGHISGALDLPYAEVEAGYRQLPKTAKIVFYCS